MATGLLTGVLRQLCRVALRREGGEENDAQLLGAFLSAGPIQPTGPGLPAGGSTMPYRSWRRLTSLVAGLALVPGLGAAEAPATERPAAPAARLRLLDG